MADSDKPLSFDYSKWDNIELSDDDTDLHPNIDANSWFQLKHRMRVEREEKETEEKKTLTREIAVFKKRVAALEKSGEKEEERKILEEKIKKHENTLVEMEKNKKWNWENMCNVVDERTDVLTKKDPEPEKKKILGPMSAEEEMSGYTEFKEIHKDLLENFVAKFGKTDVNVEDFGEIHQFVRDNGAVLLSNHASTYMLLTSLEAEMRGDTNACEMYCKTSQFISNVTELGNSMKRPPQDLINPFFKKFKIFEVRNNFYVETNKFFEKVKLRAVDKKKEEERLASEEPEYEEVVLSKEERLGPGGLDPIEVLESLPVEMQEAFNSREVDKLKSIAQTMDQEVFHYHFQRCIDAGLWVTNNDEDPTQDIDVD